MSNEYSEDESVVEELEKQIYVLNGLISKAEGKGIIVEINHNNGGFISYGNFIPSYLTLKASKNLVKQKVMFTGAY